MAATNKVAINDTSKICIKPPSVYIGVPNIQTRNITLNTDPIIEPSLWKLVPSGIIVSQMSSDTPMSLAAFIFTGIEAALEQVASDVMVAGNMFFQNAFTPFLPAAIKA